MLQSGISDLCVVEVENLQAGKPFETLEICITDVCIAEFSLLQPSLKNCSVSSRRRVAASLCQMCN
jgi:hypothetical protein